MKYFFITLLALNCFHANAQIVKSVKNGIYFNADDYKSGVLHYGFNRPVTEHMRLKIPIGHNHQLWIKTKDSTYKFNDDEIWGYRQNDVDYRFFAGDIYEVGYTDNICIYYFPTVSLGALGTVSCFSKGLTGNIFKLSKTNLLTEFKNNAEFVNKLKQLKNIYKINKQTGTFYFVEWLKN